MNFSSLIVDHYDDPRGVVLRELCPSLDEMPEFIKTADFLAADEHEARPDTDFAVIALEGGRKFRKFAMHDAGNTALSTAYLLRQSRFLPEQVVKIAAANLLEAHETFGLELPVGLAKLARAFAPKPAAATIPGVPRRSLKEQAAEDFRLEDEGLGGHDKTASDNGFAADVLAKFKDVARQEGRYVEVREIPHPVAAYEPRHTLVDGKFPVDTFDQIKTAERYFVDHKNEMSPELRHRYCTKLAERVDTLGGIKLSEEVRAYSHQARSPTALAFIEARGALVQDEFKPAIDEILKTAGDVSNEALAAAVDEFDRGTGLNHRWGSKLPDPILTVYGPPVKTASEEWSWTGGGCIVRRDQLYDLLEDSMDIIKRQFEEEFMERFRKDPIKAFESLPGHGKVALARIATSQSHAI